MLFKKTKYPGGFPFGNNWYDLLLYKNQKKIYKNIIFIFLFIKKNNISK